MPFDILIAQSDPQSTKLLANLFAERGDVVRVAETQKEGLSLLKERQPDLVVVDVRLVRDGWEKLLKKADRRFPDTKVLFTANFPDSQLETKIGEKYPSYTLLRQPFTRSELEHSLETLEQNARPKQISPRQAADLPKIRIPVRIKITLPYVVLALLLAIAAAYVVSQVVLDTIEERFTDRNR
jgi:adenylate cyclase